jgi:hypothetical protein
LISPRRYFQPGRLGCVASKPWDLITHICTVISQENGILSFKLKQNSDNIYNMKIHAYNDHHAVFMNSVTKIPLD